ncbi:hypothetical protein RCL1_001036 [Eukaryota sp. TZLM3-RCL]
MIKLFLLVLNTLLLLGLRLLKRYKLSVKTVNSRLEDFLTNSLLLKSPPKVPFCALNGKLHSLLAFKAPAPTLRWERRYIPDENGRSFPLDELSDAKPTIKSSWHLPTDLPPLPANAPVLLMMHSMAGSSREKNVRRMAYTARLSGIRCFCLIVRGCGGHKIEYPEFRGLAGLDYRDLQLTLQHLKTIYPNSQLFVSGFSLGSILLLNYLSREPVESNKFVTAASAGFVTFDCTLSLSLSKKNQQKFGAMLRPLVTRNIKVFEQIPNIRLKEALSEGTLVAFDHHITAPAQGFNSAKDYYNALTDGTCTLLPNVSVPLLLFSTLDDPITGNFLPLKQIEQSENVVLVTCSEGGHLGCLIKDNNDIFSKLCIDFFEKVD